MTIRKLMLPALLVVALAACQAEERTTISETTTTPVETASTPAPLPPEGWSTTGTTTPAPTTTVADATSTADLPPMMSATKKPTPKTHTVNRDGTMHMPGGENAKQKCAMCHGADLKGGKVATTSCVECHSEPKWKA